MDSGLKLWGIMPATALVLSSESPTLVKAAARLAKVVFGDRIQICDGVGDQVEINAAINAASRNHVVLSAGNFYLSAPIELKGGLWLQGQSIYGTLVRLANGANCNAMQFSGVAGPVYFCDISDMSIVGNKTNNASGIGISTGAAAGYLQDVYFYNIWVQDFKEHGIYLYDAWGSRLDNLIIEFNDGNGLHVANGRALKVNNSKIISNGGHGIYSLAFNGMISNTELSGGAGKYSLYLDYSSAAQNSRNTMVSNCYISCTATGAGGIYVKSANCRIIGNVIDGTGAPPYGINIVACQYTTILGNYISGFTTPINGAGIVGDATLGYFTRYGVAKSEVFMDVLAETPNHIVVADDLTAAVPHNAVIANQPDVPRNLTVTITDPDTSITHLLVWIYGWGADGNYFYAPITMDGILTYTSAGIFARIERVSVREVTGANAGDTLAIGIGSRLGLAGKCYTTNQVIKVKKNNADYPPASYAVYVSSLYTAVDVSVGGAIVAGDDFTIWYHDNLNIIN